MGSSRFAIAICSRNRGASLERALRSVFAVLATSRWADSPEVSVLVVDNGSTDDTEKRVRSLQAEHPRLRYVCEPTVGIAVARNRALAEANAELLLFIDDDETMLPGFIEAHVDLLSSNPRVGAVGGAMDLEFAGHRPRWLSPVFLSLYSSYGVPAGDVRQLRPDEVPPFGGNLSIRVSAAAEVGEFARGLGRVDRSLVSGEETALLNSMRAAGYEIWVTGAARILHHIPAERLRFGWLLRRSLAQGRTDQRMNPRHPIAASLAHLFFGGVGLIWKRRGVNLPVLAEYVSHRAYYLGRLMEALSERRASPRNGAAGR